MKRYLTRGWLVFFVLLILSGVFVYTYTTRESVPEWTMGTVTRGTVRELVSVSGVIEAESEAELSFPVSGIVRDVLVREGDTVVPDQIIATLEQDELLAERKNAYAALRIAEADRDELIRGPRDEAREVTAATIAIARTALEQTVALEAQKVTNAYRTLLSADLEALPANRNIDSIPPTISGTYTCAEPGTYTVGLFRSDSQSGYSYRLAGLEDGTYTAYTESPGPLGSCGLSMQLDADSSYSNETWEITIPNTRGPRYTTYQNAYILAQEEETQAVERATQALDRALREATLANASPREEALVRAEALIIQREAQVNAIDARIKDRTLRAPFGGVITAVDFTRGEVSADMSVTLVASDIFTLTVRVPEIDITRIAEGQRAEVRFDARSDELVPASINFISETATEIDGVAYFEASLRFDTPPAWFRDGLNADVDIVVEEITDALMIPKRFLIRDNEQTYIYVPDGTATRTIPVTIRFTGNDGFIAIDGSVRESDVIVAP